MAEKWNEHLLKYRESVMLVPAQRVTPDKISDGACMQLLHVSSIAFALG